MSTQRPRKVLAQGYSNIPKPGGMGAIVSDSPSSSSGVGLNREKDGGLTKTNLMKKDYSCEIIPLTSNVKNDIRVNSMKVLLFSKKSETSLLTCYDSTGDYIRVLEVLMNLINEAPVSLKGRIHLAVETVLGCMTELSVTVNKLEHARNYILAKINKQEDQIQDLYSELNTLRSLLANGGSSEHIRGTGDNDSVIKSLSLRGDYVESNQNLDIPILGESLNVHLNAERQSTQDDLTIETSKMQNLFEDMNTESIDKSMDILNWNAVNEKISSGLSSDDLGEDLKLRRVGRAHRYGETSLSRGKSS